MTRSRRLQRIVDLAATVERIAATALVLSERQVEECERQLQQMRSYRQEYDQLLLGGDEPVGAQTLRDQRRFVFRLDDIIAVLEHKLGQHRAMQHQRQVAWLRQHRRTQALSDVQQRTARGELLRQDARRQRELDDNYRMPDRLG
ncbi:MAG: flagellar FliJ family protein [Gammaproteobacteria bacterium]|nr:flagellar FliJ family protein [Gammaproteobacteria bacterium]